MDAIPSNDAPLQPVSGYAPEQFCFTGRGSQYFGIWIVNLLLTIVTLGVYSAWAKVRRLQYFYRHTELAGSSFDFHGSPIRILIGRVAAIGMLLVYSYAVRLHSLWTLVAVVLLAAVMPWLLRNSLRFRLHNSSWRGTRFQFRGNLPGAYRVFLVNVFLAGITLNTMVPFAHQRLKAYQHGNSWFGRTPFSFHARVGRFYLLYLVLLVLLVAIVAFLILAAAAGHILAVAAGHIGMLLIISWGALILVLVTIGPIFRALRTNLIWSNTRLGEHRIECTMSPLGLIWISLSNLVMTVLTLGLFYPWAMVRLARFQLKSVRLLPASDLQEFEASEREAIGAIGEEMATIFDFDIAL